MYILKDGIVKTRKEHKCHGCGQIIPKGSSVYSQTNTYDRIYTLYECNECQEYCESHKCNECKQNEEAYPGYVKECRRYIN